MRRVDAYVRHLTPHVCINAARVVLPLLVTPERVCFPSTMVDVQCTSPDQHRSVSLAMRSASRELVLCAGELSGMYGTFAVVEHYDPDTCYARLRCINRCVLSEPDHGAVSVRTAPDVFDCEQKELVGLVTRVHELLFELHQHILFLDTPIATSVLTKLRGTHVDQEIPFDPTDLSWFIAEILPLHNDSRTEILVQDSVAVRLELCAQQLELLVEDDGARLMVSEGTLQPGQTVKYLRTGELATVVLVHHDDPSDLHYH